MLIISWVTESTVQLPEGGDGVSQVFDELRLDIVESDTYEGVTEYTEDAVEGSAVTEHATPKLERYQVTAWISERPSRMDLVPGTSRVTPAGSPVGFITPPEGTARAADTVAMLHELRRNATLVSVEGARLPIEEWVIESVGTPRTADDAGALVANIAFREWRVATLEDVDAPSPTVERGRRRASQGTQTATQASDATPDPAPAARDSTAAALLRSALGGRSLGDVARGVQ